MRLLAPLLVLPLLLAGCATDNDAPGTGPSAIPVENGVACDPEAATPDAAWKAEATKVRVLTTMGEFIVRLDLERAPVTAGNFLKLVNEGYYDGVLFHRVIDGFVIQGGDPNSKPGGNAAAIGGGGPGYSIPDEFNPTLRHDTEGVLSMATAGPDTGGSQFFVTLAPTANLDDRHAVFGRVVEGMNVVQSIGKVATGAGDRPEADVRITKAEVVGSEAEEEKHALDVHAVIASKKAEAGRAVTYAVVLQNEGSTRDAIGLKATVPQGWTCAVNERPVVPAGTARVAFLSITPAAGASGSVEIPIAAVSAFPGVEEAAGSVTVSIETLGRAVKDGDRVNANYAGFLPDGRLFDTSMAAVGEDAEMPKFATQGGWSSDKSYKPFDFTVGSGVIAGFTNLAKTAKEGETVTMRIPAADAYATGNMYQRPLTGRDLVFELEIVKIN